MKKLASLWNNACEHARAHREAYHHTLHAGHFAYLLSVTLHGPYTFTAFICLLTLIVGYAFRLEIPDAKAIPVSPNYDKVPSKASALSPIKAPRLG